MTLANWGEMLLAVSLLAVLLFPVLYLCFSLGTRIMP